MFQNLIGNALKFRGEEPPVCSRQRMRRATCGRSACATTGSASRREYSERIFAIFQRLHPKDKYEGTGIGLAIAARSSSTMAAGSGSTPASPSGTTFRFTLPARPEASNHRGL